MTDSPQCSICRRSICRLVGGKEIYPDPKWKRLWPRLYWLCPCGAYVGCHRHTSTPLGRPIDAEGRALRQTVHNMFDPLWEEGPPTRQEAYMWLASKLKISKGSCHIAMFDKETCHRAIAVLANANLFREHSDV